MVVEEQAETIAFLQKLRGNNESVEIITTHASMIFLTDGKVYKMKKAVRYPYLDYSTAEMRLKACMAEFALNRRTAPDLYIGVHTITRAPNGELAFDGTGTMVDAALEMFRFDQECLFDRMAQQGTLTPALMEDLAYRIAAFHRDAAVSLNDGGVQGMAGVLTINEESLHATRLVPDREEAAFSQRFRQALQDHATLLEHRRISGKVRHCHGDLILRNICLWHGIPTLFDCIEFDEKLAKIDILYDLAFLLMDLWHRNCHSLANILLNRYLDVTDETDGLKLVPFFMAIRAAIRAHVTATQVQSSPAAANPSLLSEAGDYLTLALSLLKTVSPSLIAIGGLSGTGKYTIASLTAPCLAPVPGARVLNSDRIRKRLYGVRSHEKLPEEAYRPDISERVYEIMREEAGQALESGFTVIVDAVFDRPEERDRIRQLADRHNVPFNGCWLQAPITLLLSRVSNRKRDPSDATKDVVERQAERDCGMIDWVRLDATQEASLIRDEILNLHELKRTSSQSQDGLNPPKATNPS
ncbi:hypothetical protein GGR34_002002 [Microvirga flocculans]|uniref:Aminoglycoside phosphotransferase domain-containing protein n=1 Tax=Microvirga flocculans TaxID=217168 RepID=A0A7W6IGF8_9HYPH|nr:bifunctional aminoglycoside phosphotransferase/ATP-binding protein [Microvirga flocculans]MBB4040349.1 hypothetical protein [Microvirga flocculans]